MREAFSPASKFHLTYMAMGIIQQESGVTDAPSKSTASAKKGTSFAMNQASASVTNATPAHETDACHRSSSGCEYFSKMVLCTALTQTTPLITYVMSMCVHKQQDAN